jgi:tRNA threonylcarbamoyl adenosine modification protein (Sua5/YciO/YrdC/YwlC family)
MIVEVNSEHPQPRRIREALRMMKKGSLIAYPTDTVYGVGCRFDDREAVKKLQRLKSERGSGFGGPMSVIVPDLSAISQWAIMEDAAYRIVRRALPGPYTFIFKATKKVPKGLLEGQKTIGVRVPAAPVAVILCEMLGGVLLTTTAKGLDKELLNAPRQIEAAYKGAVSVVLDAGPLTPEPSTVVEMTTSSPEVLREGKGPLATIGLV